MKDYIANILRVDNFNFYTENPKEFVLVPRRCFNFELEFFTTNSGWIIMDNQYIECKKGEINFRKPGQVATGVPPYKGYIICFSLSLKNFYNELDFGNEKTKEDYPENSMLSKLPTRICPNNPTEIEQTIKTMINLFSKSQAVERYSANIILNKLLLDLLQQDNNKLEKFYNPKVVKIQKFLDKNYLNDISINEIIKDSGLSKAYFHKCFKELTGTSPANYIIKLRLNKAKNLLTFSEQSIALVAMNCGYLDSVYFTSLFKKYTGTTPSEYRKISQISHI